MRENRQTVIVRTLAATLILLTAAAWIIIPQLIESAYHGASLDFLNAMISGQSTHSLNEYLQKGQQMLILLTALTAFALIGLFAFTSESGRRLLNGITYLVVPAILPIVALTWFALRAATSLKLGHFGDEDEKLVAAWLISDGARLYDSIFAHHGPLNYMLAHAVYAVTESKEPTPYRIVQWLIIGLSSIAVSASPILVAWRQRIYAASIFLLLAATLYPAWQGHLLLYHVQAGILFVTALSLFFLPLIFRVNVPRVSAGIAGAAMMLMFAAAYPFLAPLGLMFISVALLLLARSELWQSVKQLSIPVVGGALIGLVSVLAWLFLHGDIVGYFVYHFYFNQVIYATFIDFDPVGAFKQLSRLTQPKFGWSLWVFLISWVWVLFDGYVSKNSRKDLRYSLLTLVGAVVMLVAFLYLNPRNTDELFKTAAAQVTSVALFSLIVSRALIKSSHLWVRSSLEFGIPVATLGLLFIVWFSSITGPLSQTKLANQAERADDVRTGKIIQTVQALVHPSESIEALVFNPKWYLLTSRRPASGHYYYLPWQAAYRKNPFRDRNIDICSDLKNNLPKVIIWDNLRVWGKYNLEEYEPCLYDLVTSKYKAIDGMPSVLLRKGEVAPQNWTRH